MLRVKFQRNQFLAEVIALTTIQCCLQVISVISKENFWLFNILTVLTWLKLKETQPHVFLNLFNLFESAYKGQPIALNQ